MALTNLKVNLSYVYFLDFFLLVIIKGLKRFLKEECFAVKMELIILNLTVINFFYFDYVEKNIFLKSFVRPLIIFIRLARIFEFIIEM